MTPKEYAHTLVNKFYQPLGLLKCHVPSDEMWEYAKKRAIETIDAILDAGTNIYMSEMVHFLETGHAEFWYNVKKEIENL